MVLGRRLTGLVMVLLIVVGCKEAPVPELTENLPDQVIRGFILHESASGQRLYTLTAEEAIVREKEGRIEVRRPIVTFFDDGVTVYSRLYADEGVVLTRTEDLIARNNVVIQTAESTALFTDSLIWNNSRQLVLTDAVVTIESPKSKVAGQGLVADAGLNKIEIGSEVRGSSSYEFGH